MPDALRNLIDNLRQEPIISSNSRFDSTLAKIDKYTENDFQKAYLLGYFFKHNLDSDNLSVKSKNYLISRIKQNQLGDYYYLKNKPPLKEWPIFPFLTLTIGIAAIITGITWTENGIFGFYFNPKYLVTIFKSGGYYLLFGLLLIVGSIISVRNRYRKNNFLREYFNEE